MNILKIFLAVLALSQLPVLLDEPAPVTATTAAEARRQLADLLSPQMQSVLSQNGCTDALLHRIQYGRWTDAWCASHYAHLITTRN